MGRASLQTLREMKDDEIESLVRGLNGKTIISDGSFLKKAMYSGAKVALARPRTVFDLVWSLAKG